LGIDLQDSRFVKQGHSVLDGLMSYYVKGSGFTHVKGGGSGADGMSTEQGFYALVAVDRAVKGQGSLYAMADADLPQSGDTVRDIQDVLCREVVRMICNIMQAVGEMRP